jgi:hypothetical protein
LGSDHSNVAKIAQLAHDRNIEQPGKRTNHQALATNRDVEECANDGRVELGSRTAREFPSSISRGHRAFVRASRRHHFKGVRHRDDACAERDLIPCDAVRVPGTIKVLVMLFNGESPLTEPGTERFNHSTALYRMAVENLPLRRRGRSRLIQYVNVDRNLSHIVQQRRPSQPVAVGLRESKFISDEVGVGAYALGVATSASIMGAKSSHHHQNLRGCLQGFTVT